jgi:hypothetical protein
LRKPDFPNVGLVGTLAAGFTIVLCVLCFVGMGTLLAQSTRGVSSDTSTTQPPRSVEESGTLVHDIIQQRMPLNAAATVTGSSIAEHDERPFRRKPKKNVLVDALSAVLFTALLVVAVFLVAWIRRRHMLPCDALASVATFDPAKKLHIESFFIDKQSDTASEEAREESCQSR